MKPFNGRIFYGNGDLTKRDIEELNLQIAEVHSINSGLQQPCHCVSEEAHKRCKEAEAEGKARLKVLGKSIKKALGIE